LDTVINQWNQSADGYSEFESTSRYSNFCREFVTNHFQNIKGLHVLDAGCGNGVFTHILSQNGGNVIGCDGSVEMLKLAKAKHPQYQFDEINLFYGMPYKDMAFDLVFCNLVLMDVDPIDNILSEFNRILTADGILFFSIIHPAFYHASWERNEHGIIDGKKVKEYITPFSLIQNAPWGETTHYHRPISYYYNKASAAGFRFVQMYEPSVYEDAKIPDIPLYMFAEFSKMVHAV
jgi:ubiquinone/menaquinone biosynthesis C-methylase UbiE